MCSFIESSGHSGSLLKHALELSKPVLMLNVGPTRADTIPGLEKIEVQSGFVLRDVVKRLAFVTSIQIFGL